MRTPAAAATAIIWIVMGTGLFAQTLPDDKLFQEAKILIFDKKWDEARLKLEELLARHPTSALAGQALFYRAECLGAKKGREREALDAYRDYLRSRDRNASLTEEAEGSIIDLAYALFEKGDRTMIGEIENRLEHANKVVRYYAAYKLSFVRDRKISGKSVPVLEQILRSEKDPELKDRARIALLRVSPDSLGKVDERPGPPAAARMLKIRIWEKGRKSPEVSLNIPWALADLTLSAILDSEREALASRGYNVDKIMKQIVASREILRIESEDSIIEIWIE